MRVLTRLLLLVAFIALSLYSFVSYKAYLGRANELAAIHKRLALYKSLKREQEKIRRGLNLSSYNGASIASDLMPIPEQKAFFLKHSRDGVVTISQANAAYLHMVTNLMCSLTRTNADYIRSLVFWTSDVDLGSALQNFSKRALKNPKAVQLSGFGIFYDTSEPRIEGINHGGSDKFSLTIIARGRIWLYLLEVIGTPFIFTDSDIAFLRDPFPFIAGNNGLGILLQDNITAFNMKKSSPLHLRYDNPIHQL